MKALLQKDKWLRRRFRRIEPKLQALYPLIRSEGVATLGGVDPTPFLHPLRYRVKNRCFQTGRAGSVYRRFRLSRHRFRELALSGSIGGISKSSW